MKVHIPLWTACVGCALTFVVGAGLGRGTAARAQEDISLRRQPGQEQEILSEYPYLPNRYGEVHLPSVAEWAAMQVTALGASETRLTEHFSRRHLVCAPTQRALVLTLDLMPHENWKHYAGNGKFSAPPATVKPDLEKAITSGLKLVYTFFPEIKNENIRLMLFVNNERVGEWTGGKLTLEIEKGAK